ncbi:MAG TPA: hypothetical protein VFT16_02885 [Candidatus Saccharimonadales bacterium]|nr:hypothetical protein [Candidatus Saccharimonadales bacterium]
MSNDTRFWLYRLSLFAAIAFDLWLMNKMVTSTSGGGHRTSLWATLFFMAILLTMPLALLAYKAKRERWEKAKPMDRIEVETISNYAKQEHDRKAANKEKHSREQLPPRY